MLRLTPLDLGSDVKLRFSPGRLGILGIDVKGVEAVVDSGDRARRWPAVSKGQAFAQTKEWRPHHLSMLVRT